MRKPLENAEVCILRIEFILSVSGEAARAWSGLSPCVLSRLQSDCSLCRRLGVLQIEQNLPCTSFSEELPKPQLAYHRLCAQHKQNTLGATVPLGNVCNVDIRATQEQLRDPRVMVN